MKKIILSLFLILVCLFAVNVYAEDSTVYTDGNFLYTVSNNQATIVRNSNYSYKGDLTIPNKLGGYPVVAIGTNAFGYQGYLTSVILPDSVTTLMDKAFDYCSSLKSINLDNVTTVMDSAFSSCSKFENVNLNKVTHIGARAFESCAFTEITIPDNCYVGEYAFIFCDKLSTVATGDNIIFDDSAFYNCPKITKVEIGKNCDIGNSAFTTTNSSLIYLSIEEGSSIGNAAFSASTKLTELILGDVVKIGENAFKNCRALKEVKIPGSVEVIEKNAFYCCDAIEKLIIGEGVKVIDKYAFYNPDGLVELYLPSTITDINYGAFSDWATIGNLAEELYVYYYGRQNQWDSINLNNSGLRLDNLLCNYRPIDPTYIPVYVNDVTIIGKGTAYGRFNLKYVNNTPVKNKAVQYSLNGINKGTAETDEYGYVCIEIDNITQSGAHTVMFTGNNIQTTVGVINVTVEPIKFKAEHEAAITGGLNLGLAFGVGGSVGEFEGEATLAEIGASLSGENSLTVEQEIEGDNNKLTITTRQNIEFASEAKAGLFAGVDIANTAGVEGSVGDVTGEGKSGFSYGVGYEDESFNKNDADDINAFSRFFASALLENFNKNAAIEYIIDKINAPVNVYEKGSTLSLEAGASLAVFEYGAGNLSSEAELAGGSAAVVSENTTTTHPDGSISYKSKTATEAGVSFASLKLKAKKDKASLSAGLDTFSSVAKNAATVSAKKSSTGSLTEISITAEEVTDSSVFMFKDTTVNKHKISYEGAAARNVADDNSHLNSFTEGAKGHFGKADFEKTANTMIYSGENGEYTISKAKKHGVELDVSGTIKAFLTVGGSVGLSGIETLEYDEYTGVYENNAAYIQAYNDIEDDIKDKYITLDEAIEIAKSKISETILYYWDVAKGYLDEAKDTVVKAGRATVKKTKDAASGWYASITNPNEDADSFSVLAVSDGVELLSDYAGGVTIGNPYIITVEDEAGNAVVDFSENPLELTIGYTDEMLNEANANENGLTVLYWDDEKAVYVKAGGTLDKDNNQMHLVITKPGQYVLAYDTQIPDILNFEYHISDGGFEISAIVKDASGIDNLTLTFNNKEVINKDNLADYYNYTTGELKYKTEALEPNRTYQALLIVTDVFGNENYIRKNMYYKLASFELLEIGNCDSIIGQNQIIELEVKDDNWVLDRIYMIVEVCDIHSNTSTIVVNATTEDGVLYTAKIPEVLNGSTANIWFTGTDNNGNTKATPKKQVTILDNADRKHIIAVTKITDNTVVASYFGEADLSDCKMMLAMYNADGTLYDVKSMPAENTVSFDCDTENKFVRVYLWSVVKPLCQSALIATDDTLF